MIQLVFRTNLHRLLLKETIFCLLITKSFCCKLISSKLFFGFVGLIMEVNFIFSYIYFDNDNSKSLM